MSTQPQATPTTPQWAIIKHRPGIIVYDDGRVFTTKLGRFLSVGRSSASNGRYLRYSVGKKKVGLHVLIAEAFIGPRPSPHHLCLHKDDDKNNNTVGNLYWGTKKDNALDALRNGKMHAGEKSHSAKLSERAVVLIRKLVAGGETHAAIANSFNVSQSTITDIVNRKKWTHVK